MKCKCARWTILHPYTDERRDVLGNTSPRDRQISLDVFPRLKAVYSHCLYMVLFILSTLCPFASLLQHYQHFPHENVCLIFVLGSVFPNAQEYIS